MTLVEQIQYKIIKLEHSNTDSAKAPSVDIMLNSLPPKIIKLAFLRPSA
jgi:hypothetical protein